MRVPTTFLLLTIAGSAFGLTPEEAYGKRIYTTGAVDGVEVAGAAVSGPFEVFACVQCHGSEGEGSSEAASRIPPIVWTRLLERGYNGERVTRAVEQGAGATGGPFQSLMPRYKLSILQRSALLAYLKILGTDRDADPGVSADRVLVGVALPLSGPLAATGEAMRRVLANAIAAVNGRGGVFGRSFELVAEDSATDLQAAVQRLVEQRGAFALVANFQPGLRNAVDDYLREQGVPSIGPLGSATRQAAREHPNVFRFLPTLADEADVMYRFLSEENQRRKALLIELQSPAEAEAAASFAASAMTGALKIAVRVKYARGLLPTDLADRVRELRPDCVLFLGASEDLPALMAALGEGSGMLVAAPAQLRPGAAKLLTTYPGVLPGAAESTELEELAGGELTHALPQALAFAAIKVFTEAARLSGRRLTRASLTRALGSLGEFAPGVIPALSFSNGRRVGSNGAYVVQLSTDASGVNPVSEWLTPAAK